MSNGKREDIQGLRALAIVFVLFFHFFPNLFPNGYIGVDIFFVISGFLMCMILSKHTSINYSVMRKFYSRRIQRIFPLYYATILFILALIVLVLPDVFVETNPKFGLKAIMLITNIKNDNEDTYQLEMAGARNLFTHTWSLCLELQFYLIVPIIMLISKCLSKKVSSEFVYLYFATASLIYFLMLPADVAFNSVLARIWQFMCGFLAFEFGQDNDASLPARQKRTQLAYSSPDKPWIGYIALIFLLSGTSYFSIESLTLRLVCTISTALIIRQGSFLQVKPLTNRCLYYIGEASYSIYLIHWPICLCGKALQADEISYNELALFCSIFLGFLIHFLFEKRFLTWSSGATFVFIGFGIVASFGIALSCAQLKQFVQEPNGVNFSTTLEEAIKWNNENAMEREGNPQLEANSSGCVYDYYKDEKDKKRFATCPKGLGSYKILVLGNSYAMNQLGVVYKHFHKYASDFRSYYHPGCEVLSDNRNSYCKRDWKYGYEKVARGIQPDVIFMINGGDHFKRKIESSDIKKDPVFAKAVKKLEFFESLPSVKRIYMFGALPSFVGSSVSKAVGYLKKGQQLKDSPSLVVHDEVPMKIRFEELEKVCRKCKVINPLPRFTNQYAKEKFVVFDEHNHMFITNPMHFTRLGLQRLEKVYADLEPDFTDRVLKNLQ